MFDKLKYALYVLLFAGVFTACSDDDDLKVDTEVELTEQELAEMAVVDKFAAANSVIRALAIIDELPDNWEKSTFAPEIGSPQSEANPDVRNVISSSAEDARNFFLSIVPDLGLEGDTWSHDGVGTLTFRAVNEKNSYAVIDVNLVQMPGLTQVRFVPESAVGDNGKYYGDPYYKPGDVVLDKKDHIWICVRPSGGPEGKSKSYFVSFDHTLIKTKTVSQNIYNVDKNGNLNKNDKVGSLSGDWVYATNLVEERIAVAAAHTFAMLYANEFESVLHTIGITAADLVDQDPYNKNSFSTNVAYGSYISNKYKNMQQAKYLQPFLRLYTINNSARGFYKQYLYKVSMDLTDLDSASPYLLSSTTTHDPLAHIQLYGTEWIPEEGVNSQTVFDIFNYTNIYNTMTNKLVISPYRYMPKYLNEKMLVLTQTSISDNGKPNSKFKKLMEVFDGKPSDYWESLKIVDRYLYDAKNSGTPVEDLID